MRSHQLFALFTIFLLLFLPSAYAFQIPGTNIEIGWDDVAVFAGAAAVTAAILITAPVSVPAAAIAAAAIAVGAAATYGYRAVIKEPMEKSKGVTTDGEAPTREELREDEDIKRAFGDFQSEAEEAAAKDLMRIKQQLQSSLVSYDFSHEGSVGDLRVTIKGPDKIYGFSAFPIVVNIYAPCEVDPEENKVHINKVTAYVRDSETGQKWWVQTWTGDQILRNSDHTWYFILKAPDPYYGMAKSAAKGSASRDTLEKLLNAEVGKYEVCVEIKGYREIWAWKEYVDENGTVHKELVHVKDVPINSRLVSLSAWRHEKSGAYVIDGMEGSLPLKFAGERKYTAYRMKANGATSNIIARVWATPVHVLDSTADYKFCIVGNPDYFDPLEVSIVDDIALTVYGIQSGGSDQIVYQYKDKLGDLGSVHIVSTSVHYKANENTLSFDVYYIVHAVVETEDKDLPIWLVAKPAITVISNREVVLADERVKEIADLLEKGDVSQEDIERIKQVASSMISGLERKKQVAIDLKNKCANNDVARSYAEKAIYYYDAALRALKTLQTTDDPNQIATQLKLAKNYEMIGDYYIDAAEKALYGQMEQAEMSARNAQKLEEATKKYEPSMLFKAGSFLGKAWDSFKKGLGIGYVPDWVLILIVIILVVGVAIIVFKLF